MSPLLHETAHTASPLPASDGPAKAPPDMASAVGAEQLFLLYTNASFALVATVLATLLLAGLFWDTIPRATLLIWGGYMLAVTAVRSVLIWRFLRLQPHQRTSPWWWTLFLVSVAVAGVGWGAAGIWLFPDTSLPHQTLLVFVLGGLVAGAITTLPASLAAFLLFTLPTFLPVSFRLLAEGFPFGHAMGGLSILFFVSALFLAVKMHRIIMRALRLRFENADLVADLTAQIAERRRTEAALHHGEQQYRHLVEHANDVIYQTDAYGLFTFVNPTTVRLMKFSESELLGRRFVEFIRPDCRKAADRFYGRQFIRKTRNTYYEFPAMTKDGREIWFGQNVQLHLKGDRVTGFQAVARDITERKQAEDTLKRHGEELEHRVRERTAELAAANKALRDEIADRQWAEQALRESEERFRQIADTSKMVFCMSSPGFGQILYINQAYQEMWRRTCGSLLESPWSWLEAVHPEDRMRVLEAHRERTAAFSIEYRILWPDGAIRWVLSNSAPIRNEQGSVYRIAIVVEDVTERKLLEEQLRQAQKMEAIGRLAGGIAHDFNNLLTVIMGAAQLLLRRLGQDDPSRKRVERIHEASERASSLTKQLLAFSRQQVLTSRVLDLNTVVAKMDDLLRRLIGEDIILITSMDPTLGRVRADHGQIEQIVMNLAVNARDAMPYGGTLLIKTENVGKHQAMARQRSGQSGVRYVRLRVRDTGCGMGAETLKRLFEPFFTTKEPGKGTGLGLATVYGIVTQSGGSISVNSEPGEGTTFTIDLPRVEEEVPSAAPLPMTGITAEGTETILLVEDQDLVRELAEDVLRDNGYRVLLAANGLDALRIAAEHKDPIHLLLTDLVMPGMSGRELAHHLLLVRPDTRILYMSGYEHRPEDQQAMGPQAPVLAKPLHLDILMRHVRDILDASPQTDPSPLRPSDD